MTVQPTWAVDAEIRQLVEHVAEVVAAGVVPDLAEAGSLTKLVVISDVIEFNRRFGVALASAYNAGRASVVSAWPPPDFTKGPHDGHR